MRKLICFILIGYACWLGMMAIHESGHAMAAWLTGGRVQRMVLPLWGFSRTDVSPDPNRIVEVWAGPIWGCIAPLLVGLSLRKPWKLWRFFCGFCLIANGSYIAVGWTMHSGDAWELVQLGTPRWVLATVGGIGVASGLFIWHRLGQGTISPAY
jgi:hypothetical protein